MGETWEVETRGPMQTRQLGKALGTVAQMGDIVLLTGPLGTGKTQFAKGVAEGLGVLPDVTSPTFPMIAEYEGRVPLIHMDLYRLYDHPEQSHATLQADGLSQIAFDDYLDGTVVLLIEWPQGVRNMLDSALEVDLAYADDGPDDLRQVRVTARGAVAADRLREWVCACE